MAKQVSEGIQGRRGGDSGLVREYKEGEKGILDGKTG